MAISQGRYQTLKAGLGFYLFHPSADENLQFNEPVIIFIYQHSSKILVQIHKTLPDNIKITLQMDYPSLQNFTERLKAWNQDYIKANIKVIVTTSSFCLTYSYLETHKSVIGEQCRPRSDTTQCGV